MTPLAIPLAVFLGAVLGIEIGRAVLWLVARDEDVRLRREDEPR